MSDNNPLNNDSENKKPTDDSKLNNDSENKKPTDDSKLNNDSETKKTPDNKRNNKKAKGTNEKDTKKHTNKKQKYSPTKKEPGFLTKLFGLDLDPEQRERVKSIKRESKAKAKATIRNSGGKKGSVRTWAGRALWAGAGAVAANYSGYDLDINPAKFTGNLLLGKFSNPISITKRTTGGIDPKILKNVDDIRNQINATSTQGINTSFPTEAGKNTAYCATGTFAESIYITQKNGTFNVRSLNSAFKAAINNDCPGWKNLSKEQKNTVVRGATTVAGKLGMDMTLNK